MSIQFSLQPGDASLARPTELAQRRSAVLASGLPIAFAVVVFAVYWSSRPAGQSYSALSIACDIELGPSLHFWHHNHPLYTPTGRLLWKGWQYVNDSARSVGLLQSLNALATSACTGVLFWLVARLTSNVLAALSAAGMLAFSYQSWLSSVEVGPYPFALCWQLLALTMLSELATRGHKRILLLLGVGSGMAILFHQPNGLLVPVVALAALSSPVPWRQRLQHLLVCAVTAGGVVVLGIISVGLKSYRTFGEILGWMFFFLNPGAADAAVNWSTVSNGLGAALTPESSSIYWAMLVALFAVGLPAAARTWPRIVVLCLFWVLTNWAAAATWQPTNPDFWISPLLPLSVLVGLCASTVMHRLVQMGMKVRARRLGVLMCLPLLVLGWRNRSFVRQFAADSSRWDSAIAEEVRRLTAPNDIIVSAYPTVALHLSYYQDRHHFRQLDASARQRRSDVIEKHAAKVASDLHAGAGLMLGQSAVQISTPGLASKPTLDSFWDPYRPAMKPAVTRERDVVFWRIPSASELAHADGWRWQSFDWGWDPENVHSQSFDGAWCFSHRSHPKLMSPKIYMKASGIRSVKLRMGTESESPEAQLIFFLTNEGRPIVPHVVRWKLQETSDAQSYDVPLTTLSSSGAIVTRLLIELLGGQHGAHGRTCVESLRFVLSE